MDNNAASKTPTMESMKKSILDAGGLFYQYRPCRRDASTIYDIENIRHGVVYAQTPLNMNDPFDSMIGFSAEKIYNDIIVMLVDACELDKELKVIFSLLLQYKAFGKIAEFIIVLQQQKEYINSRRKAMHQTHVPFETFVSANLYNLYAKAPKRLKEVFDITSFHVFGRLLSQMGEIDISEKNLFDIIKMEDVLDELHKKAEEIRDNTYLPTLRKFIAQLTVSCFSVSGWDNQLMWSHYANSYSGICVEYDFSKIEKFNGFIFPVKYNSERPTLAMRDLGYSGIDLKSRNMIKCETDIGSVFEYILNKNECWSYEEEWRIINIGEENTPVFIELPYIQSITFGLHTDPLCKRLLLEVCKDKGIDCYDLKINNDNYVVQRELISEVAYNTDDEVAYVALLSNQMLQLSQRLQINSQNVTKSISDNSFDFSSFEQMLVATEDYLSNAYFLKASFNRVCENTDDDKSKMEIPNGIVLAINGIDSLVIIITNTLDKIENAVLGFSISGQVNWMQLSEANKHIKNVKELIDRFNDILWDATFLINQYNMDQVISHYDSLIDEGNDPVKDTRELKEYMDKWDGEAFIESLDLNDTKSVLEIGVGTGRIALKTAARCADFTGIDISPKTIEVASKNLEELLNVTLICDDFLKYKFDKKFDIIYSSLTFMHISNKLQAILKISDLLVENGICVISLDKSQEEYIDFGTRKVLVYPDNVDSIGGYFNAAKMTIERQFDTENAIIVIAKHSNDQ